MSQDIYQSINLHGNYISNARVSEQPKYSDSVTSRQYVDSNLVTVPGIDGFQEAEFEIKKMLFKNSNITSREEVFCDNRPYNIFLICKSMMNSRTTINSVSLNITNIDNTQTLSVPEFRIYKNTEFTIDDTVYNKIDYTEHPDYPRITNDEMLIVIEYNTIISSRLVLSSMLKDSFVIFNVSITYSSVNYEYLNHNITHEQKTISSSKSIEDIDYYISPVILDYGNDVETIDDITVSDGSYVLNKINYINSFYECDIQPSSTERQKFLILAPKGVFYIVLLDASNNEITDHLYYSVDTSSNSVTWMGTKFYQMVIDLGYITGTDTEIKFQLRSR